jgi:hypothetical protein
MNSCLKLTPAVKPIPIATSFAGQVTGYDQQHNCWIIDELYLAPCAASLLVKPGEGDKVCFVQVEDDYYITQILSRKAQSEALLIETKVPLHLVAPAIQLTAFETLEMVSLNRIAVMGKNYILAAKQSVIQQTENWIQQVGQCSITAKGVMRLNAKQQVITAEEDVRVDGKRINMG